MTTHTITLDTDEEHEAALTDLVTIYNEQNKTTLTADQFLVLNLQGIVKMHVQKRYNDALVELGTLAANLSYSQRQALMEQVRNAIPA